MIRYQWKKCVFSTA